MKKHDQLFEDRMTQILKKLISDLNRITAWQLLGYVVLFLAFAACVLLSGCGSDYASPFEKPDATVQPIECSASASCG